MEADRPGRDAVARLLGLVVVLALLIVVAVLLQHQNHAFSAELGDDDGSHYISGLFVRDYLASGLAMSPLDYVKWYHAHYPLVGIGHWGPTYYLVEGLWMLAVSPGIPAAILLAGLFAAATAFLVYLYGTRRLGLAWPYALGAAVLFLLLPMVQSGSATIMLDIPIALMALGATLAYALYLDSGKARYSALFGLLAAAALLTKGNAVMLALVPPLAIIFTGRWELLRTWGFWLPAALVALLTGPWTLLTYAMVSEGFRYHWGPTYSWVATVQNARILWDNLGPALLVLAGVGVVSAIRDRAAPQGPSALCLLALLIAVWAFQTVVPAAIQDRYLTPLMPPLLLFTALGARSLVDRLTRGAAPRWAPAAAFGLMLLAGLPAALQAQPRQPAGLRELARVAWSQTSPQNPVVLVVARGAAEAGAVAELAALDPARPSLFAVRGSRLLGAGGYNRADYQPKFQNAGQVAGEIDRMKVPLVLYQPDQGGWLHVSEVDQARAAARPPWRLIGQAGGPARQVSLYALPQAHGKAADVNAWLALAAPKQLQ